MKQIALVYAILLATFPVSLAVVMRSDELARAAGPTVVLDNGTFTGVSQANGDVSAFLGIPFAKPPYACSSSYLIVS